MIPKNITKELVIEAINKINLEGIPKRRESTRYNLKFMGKSYPPKYIISVANKFVNSEELKPYDFSGGEETNNFLSSLGFEIVECVEVNKEAYVPIEGNVIIATVLIESYGQQYNEDRTTFLEKVIKQIGKHADIILLPAGFYYINEKPDLYYSTIEEHIVQLLSNEDLDTVVCLGIDGRESKDQIGLAINKQGIIAIGRKFNPTEGEQGKVDAAADYLQLEDGYSRIIDVQGKRLYMAICYDGLGIRKQNINNPGVDGILNLVHRFNPIGYDGSGDVYFAKHSFASSSKQWNCTTFGAVTFFNRNIPDKWPSGVLWNQGDKMIKYWKYSDNAIMPNKNMEIQTENEKGIVRFFNI